ncbi:MAG: hypothetical protein WD963_02200 [Candidatus Paceibacterota bacterium]
MTQESQNQDSTENPSSIDSTQDLRPTSSTEPALENSTDLGDLHPSVPVEGLGADGGNLKEEEYHNIPPSDDSTPPELEKTQEIPIEPASPPADSGSHGTGQQNETAQTPVSEPLAQPKSSLARELLIKARNAIQFRKRKKLDRIMTLFDKKKNGSTGSPQVTNDEVEKLLHVSDATATRYLSQLKKEGRIKQNGKTGRGVSYSKMQ